MRLRTRNLSILAAMLLVVLLCFGCSSTGSIPFEPSGKGSIDNLPSLGPYGRMLSEVSIGTEGGSIDIGWLTLEFLPGSLKVDTTVELFESNLAHPKPGTVVGGFPVRIRVRAMDSSPGSPLNPTVGYICRFNLDKLPEGMGDFTSANRYVDIYGEWLNPNGTVGKGAAWAKRDGDTVTRRMIYDETTIALVDFEGIPELTAEPVFTDDPRTLSGGPYTRYADVAFNTANLGPQGGRIPVILIHGLQLDNMEEEPYELNDEEALYGEDGWIPFLDSMNNYSPLFKDYKFYWYCYPSGDSIFGSDGIAASLRDKIDEWPSELWDEPPSERPFVIVCHSMGGLVAREFVRAYSTGLPVPRIIAVATPHYGSPIVNVGADLVDIPLFGWLDSFLTDGVMDLACDETIKYEWLWIEYAADINQNLNLRTLNQQFPENDPRLIEFGSTTTSIQSPSFGSTHYLALTIMKMVTSPSWLGEAYKGYHSDTVVNWTSQYYTKNGNPDLSRNSNRMHMDIMSDPEMHLKIFMELYGIKAEFE